MVDLIEETEAVPAVYPAVDPRWMVGNYLDDGADTDQDKDPGTAQVWQRIESWTRTRYTSREVVWIVEGDAGDTWKPPLSPVTAYTVEHWDDEAWAAATLTSGPVGHILPSSGHYRITAQVGGGDVPPAVAEAFKRLHEYSRGIAEQFKGDAGMVVMQDTTSVVYWAGKALQLSGAADALRPYRRRK
jgi:hypothetical protein